MSLTKLNGLICGMLFAVALGAAPAKAQGARPDHGKPCS